MTDDEHKQIAADFYHGKVLFGLDRMVARQFFMDIPFRIIEEKTGEAPYLEMFTVWALLIAGHLGLVLSWVLAFVAFGWWSALLIPGSLVVYFIFTGHSSLPGHGLLGITIALAASVAAAVVDVFPSRAIGWYFVVLLLSLWAARSVYSAAWHFVRAFVLRNGKAYEMLSSRIDIRAANE